MTVILVAIGLAGSIVAFVMSIVSLRKMVKEDHITSAIPLDKFAAIRNTFISMVVATALLYGTLLGAGTFAYLAGETVKSSLCTLRSDLQTRVDSSKDFLVRHPEGIPGISKADIQQGIENQERTVGALDELECDE